MNQKTKDNMDDGNMLDFGKKSIKSIIELFNNCIPDNGKCNCEYVDGLSVEEYLQMKRGIVNE